MMKSRAGRLGVLVLLSGCIAGGAIFASGRGGTGSRDLPPFEDVKWQVLTFTDPLGTTRTFGAGGIPRYLQWYFDSTTKTLTVTMVESSGAPVATSFNYRKDEGTVVIDFPDGSLYLVAQMALDAESQHLTMTRLAPAAQEFSTPAETFGTVRDGSGNIVGPAVFGASTIREPDQIVFRRL